MALSAHVPDLGALEVLQGVARTGSLNSAAEQIGVSQQAVSARIRGMEAQTGVPLLRRSPRGSSLTPQGAMIEEWASRLLEVAAGLDASITALRADRRSRLRVSSSSTIAEQLLPVWLASFRLVAGHGGPALDVVLTAVNTETVISHVTEGTADLGFIEGPRQPTGLQCRIIGHDRLAVVVAPGHPWTRRRSGISAAELAAAPLISRENGSGTRATLAVALTAALGPGYVQAPAALSVSTSAAVRATVLADAAPAVISKLAVADDLSAGRLTEVVTPELDLHRTLRVIWAGAPSPPAGAARDLIAHIASRTTGLSASTGRRSPDAHQVKHILGADLFSAPCGTGQQPRAADEPHVTRLGRWVVSGWATVRCVPMLLAGHAPDDGASACDVPATRSQ